jgi:BrxA
VSDSQYAASRYSLSFTAASLRPELARVVAEAYLACGDWQETRRRVLDDNLLQTRSRGSAFRMEGEVRQRLQTLTPEQLTILAEAPSDSRHAVAWLSVLKLNTFVFNFAAGTLRAKIEAHDVVVRPSDYEEFIASESVAHPEVLDLTPVTKAKIRQVLFKMLREAGILGEGRDDFDLQRALLPADVLRAVVSDDRRWLAGFLVPDDEIATIGD